jgi:hypothetical protein
MLSNFQVFKPTNAIDAMIQGELATLKNREQQLANEKTQTEKPYWAQNFASDSETKRAQAMFAQQKARMDYERSIVDYDKAKIELEMYPQSQAAKDRLAQTQAQLNAIQIRHPGLLGTGKAKESATWDVLNETGGSGNYIQPPIDMPSNANPVNSPQANQNIKTAPYENSSINNAISTNPEIANKNYPSPLPMNSPSPQDILKLEAQKTPAQAAREKQNQVEEAKVYSGQMKLVAEQSQKALDQNAGIEAVLNAYQKVPNIQKGTIKGLFPAGSQGALVADALEKNIILEDMLKQRGVQGEGDRKAIEAKFQGRRLNNEEKEQLLTLYKINNDRSIEKARFFADRKTGDPYQTIAEWNEMINSRSVFKEPAYLAMERRQRFKNMTPEQLKQAEMILAQEIAIAEESKRKGGM